METGANNEIPDDNKGEDLKMNPKAKVDGYDDSRVKDKDISIQYPSARPDKIGKKDWTVAEINALVSGYEKYRDHKQPWAKILEDPCYLEVLGGRTSYELGYQFKKISKGISLVPVVSPIVFGGNSQLKYMEAVYKFFKAKERGLTNVKLNPQELIDEAIVSISITRRQNPDAKAVEAFFEALINLTPESRGFLMLCNADFASIKPRFDRVYTALKAEQCAGLTSIRRSGIPLETLMKDLASILADFCNAVIHVFRWDDTIKSRPDRYKISKLSKHEKRQLRSEFESELEKVGALLGRVTLAASSKQDTEISGNPLSNLHPDKNLVGTSKSSSDKPPTASTTSTSKSGTYSHAFQSDRGEQLRSAMRLQRNEVRVTICSEHTEVATAVRILRTYGSLSYVQVAPRVLLVTFEEVKDAETVIGELKRCGTGPTGSHILEAEWSNS